MTDNMIERVADVLLNAGCGDSDQCERIARAVIAAMREPTADMLERCCDLDGPRRQTEKKIMRDWHVRLIDAALAEGDGANEAKAPAPAANLQKANTP